MYFLPWFSKKGWMWVMAKVPGFVPAGGFLGAYHVFKTNELTNCLAN